MPCAALTSNPPQELLSWSGSTCGCSAPASASIPSRLGALGKGPWQALGAPGLSPRVGIPHCSGLLFQGPFHPSARLFLKPCAAAGRLLHSPVINSLVLGCYSLIPWLTSCFSRTPQELQLLHRDREYLTFQACPVPWDVSVTCWPVKPPQLLHLCINI